MHYVSIVGANVALYIPNNINFGKKFVFVSQVLRFGYSFGRAILLCSIKPTSFGTKVLHVHVLQISTQHKRKKDNYVSLSFCLSFTFVFYEYKREFKRSHNTWSPRKIYIIVDVPRPSHISYMVFLIDIYT